MKPLYLIYAILAKGVSVLRVVDYPNPEVTWCAHDKPQDGYGGHDGKWVTAKTPQEAVWKLRKVLRGKK